MIFELIEQFHAISGQKPKTILLGYLWHERSGKPSHICGIPVVILLEDPWAFGLFSVEPDDGT